MIVQYVADKIVLASVHVKKLFVSQMSTSKYLYTAAM